MGKVNWADKAVEACQIINPDHPDLVANEIENIVRLLARIVLGQRDQLNQQEAEAIFTRMKLPAIRIKP